MATLYIVWAIVGGGAASALTMRFWRPDPPPLVKIIPIHLGGVLGGIVVGVITHPGLLQLGPLAVVILPALITVASGGALAASLVAFTVSRGGGPGR
jgi:hypothetical protein